MKYYFVTVFNLDIDITPTVQDTSNVIQWDNPFPQEQETFFKNAREYIESVKNSVDRFDSRAYFPKKWGGLLDEKLRCVSGIESIRFCHTGLTFIVVDVLGDALRCLDYATEKIS